MVVSTSKVLDAPQRVRLERHRAGLLPKSELTDCSAAAELRRICHDWGSRIFGPKQSSRHDMPVCPRAVVSAFPLRPPA